MTALIETETKTDAEIIFERCLDAGMVPPFILTLVGVNGSVSAYRYSATAAGFKREVLVEHIEVEGYAVPLNFMIVDGNGRALQVRIEQEDIQLFN